MKKEISIDGLFERVYQILKGKKKHYEEIEAIYNVYKKELPISSYDSFVFDWFLWNLNNENREELTGYFRNYFSEELRKRKTDYKNTSPIIACMLVGIYDLLLQGFSQLQKNRVVVELYKRLLFDSERDYEILIVGETGTGKELFAKAIHLMGNRNKAPFQDINCAAIPDSMLESELFGYEKGAFTGADKQKQGLFELAGNGIIFLDELGKMPKYLQAKILKAIQDKKYGRLGGNTIQEVNARFIAATQPGDLENIMPDLKYRFGYPDTINIPTLNQRMPLNPRGVTESALVEALRIMGEKKLYPLKDETVILLSKHDYKGNFRELCSVLRHGIREAIMDNRKDILPKDIIDKLNTPEATRIEEGAVKGSNIKLKDIFDYAHDVNRKIVEEKIVSVLQSGKDLKTALAEEGMTHKDYQAFRKKFQIMTGKGLRDLIQ